MRKFGYSSLHIHTGRTPITYESIRVNTLCCSVQIKNAGQRALTETS